LVHPGAAGYAFISTANDIEWDATPSWVSIHTFQSGLAIAATMPITMGDDAYIGLGAASGRIIFDSTPATHLLTVDNAQLQINDNVGIGAAPDATDLLTVTYSGAPGAAIDGVYTTVTVTDGNNLSGLFFIALNNTAAAVVANMYGIRGRAENASTGAVTSMWGGDFAVSNNSNPNVTTAWGLQSEVSNNYTGTIITAWGVEGKVTSSETAIFAGQITAGAAIHAVIEKTNLATFVTAYGVKIGDWVTTGNATTSYGLHIDTTVDFGVTSWAIYSASTSDSYFAGKVGINTASADDWLHVVGTTFTTVICERTTAATNTPQAGFTMRATTSNNMVDEFGAGIAFQIEDVAGVANLIGTIYAIRDSADTEGALIFRCGTNGTEEFMRINNIGYVGIGTNSPDMLLDLEDSTALIWKATNTGASGAGGGAGFQNYHDDGAAMANGDRLGFFTYGGAEDAAHTLYNATAFTAFAEENWGAAAKGANIRFETTALGAAARTERLRISADGLVGVWTLATPSGLLHVNQSSATGARPTLMLEQDDESEEFIRFVGQSDDGVLTNSIVNENDITTWTSQGALKVYVVDEDGGDPITDQAYFLRIYTLA
jgi:hypothetical protein